MYSVWATPKGGLPHSDIRGSKGARPSPRLFAACHVLHRLLVPRHPLNALLTLLRDWPPCAEPSLRKAQPITTTSHTLVAFSNAFAQHPGPKVARRGQTHAAPYPGAAFRTIFTLTKNNFGQDHDPPPSGVQGHDLAKPSGETFPETQPINRSTGTHQDWWRWTGSNRRPPACKAGALPAELHPRSPSAGVQPISPPDHCQGEPTSQTKCGQRTSGPSSGPARRSVDAARWWAEQDLNLRPHAYQACALTS